MEEALLSDNSTRTERNCESINIVGRWIRSSEILFEIRPYFLRDAYQLSTSAFEEQFS